MKVLIDCFRLRWEPARTLHDAVVEESQHRSEHTDWIERERHRMHQTAICYAQQHGLNVPTLDEVRACERLAEGHVDYMRKWALGVAAIMTQKPEKQP